MTDDDLQERIAALEARVAALEGSDENAPAPSNGTVTYSGDVHLHGAVRWSIEYSAGAIPELPPERSVEVLAALGHPVRFAVVRELLRGPATAADLQSAAGLSSVGQLYHHLKTLTSARVVEQHGRGDYRLAARTVVPALVLMLGAADIAGELR